MKKFMIFALCTIFLFAACGSAVSIVIPADLLGSDDPQTMADQFTGTDGIKKVSVNDDNSITMVVTEEKYEQQLSSIEETIVSMYETVGVEGGFFETVTGFDYNDDYTTLVFTVNREALEEASDTEKTSIEQVIYIARLYRVFALENDEIITVKFVDEATGAVYEVKEYTAAGEVSTEDATL
ncbi:MAG: hypothetical protein LUG52_05730 [Clostridia bacterium]|nr:hypothetical protein [Clostridia bacterium]